MRESRSKPLDCSILRELCQKNISRVKTKVTKFWHHKPRGFRMEAVKLLVWSPPCMASYVKVRSDSYREVTK